MQLGLFPNSSKQEIIRGDCLDVMKIFPDNHFSCIVTDPPYGLNFMGKKWDSAPPNTDIWKEALRVCKPGSHFLAFGGTRTHHHLMLAIEEAGWEIRDCIIWIYGSGFPKSHNHFGFEGYGTALKPSHEPIIVAMKPLNGTFVQNAEKWGVAGLNIDGCRIEGIPRTTHSDGNYKGSGNDIYSSGLTTGYYSNGSSGRWPANVIFDEEAGTMLDEQNVGASRFFYCAKASASERNKGLEGMQLRETGIKNDSGRGFSESDPYAKRLSYNHHPTVKPLKLMEYLIKLVTPPSGGILLDPFAGSGSTILAAKNLDIIAIGIEKESEYCDIAKKRLEC